MTGRVQVYTGDGKGKTTAAAGLALRAAGAGMSVFIGQFIKARESHEMKALRTLCPRVTVERFGRGCFIRGTPAPEDVAAAAKGVARLREALAGGAFDVVIADEACGAVEAGVIGRDDLLSLLEARPEHVELVFTGRNAPRTLLERADLVTEMRCVRHYFDDGVAARRGIEF